VKEFVKILFANVESKSTLEHQEKRNRLVLIPAAVTIQTEALNAVVFLPRVIPSSGFDKN
jgi:hypothetical protein